MRTELCDGRIRIRHCRSEDVEPLHLAVAESIPELSAWLPWAHPGYSRKESAEWLCSREAAWEAGEAYDFLIEEAKGSMVLGGCGLNKIDRDNLCANLGYWVRSSCVGHGVATAAARLTARFGFEDLDLQRIEILAATGNRASQRVARKLGAKKEGVLRSRFLLQGRPQDGVLYSLTPDGLPAR